MNKLEVYSDLSFNFDTDFESMLMESMIDDAMCEAHEAHMALESYLEKKNGGSFDDALESLMAVLEGKDEDCCDDEECDDDDCKKKKKDSDEDDEDEDAEEAYLRSVCEAADASLGQKIAAAWKAFKEKVIAFLSRIANSLKNIATKFQITLARKAKSDVIVPSGDKYILESMNQIEKYVGGMSIEDKGNTAANSSIIESLLANAAKMNEKNKTEVMTAADIKSALSNVSATLKACQKALTNLDREVNAKIRSGSQDARSDMADARTQINSAMKAIRQSTSAIVGAVSKAGKKKESGKGAKGAADNEQPIEKVEAEIVDNK